MVGGAHLFAAVSWLIHSALPQRPTIGSLTLMFPGRIQLPLHSVCPSRSSCCTRQMLRAITDVALSFFICARLCRTFNVMIGKVSTATPAAAAVLLLLLHRIASTTLLWSRVTRSCEQACSATAAGYGVRMGTGSGSARAPHDKIFADMTNMTSNRRCSKVAASGTSLARGASVFLCLTSETLQLNLLHETKFDSNSMIFRLRGGTLVH